MMGPNNFRRGTASRPEGQFLAQYHHVGLKSGRMNRLKTLCLQVYTPILRFRSWCPARLVSGDLGNDVTTATAMQYRSALLKLQ